MSSRGSDMPKCRGGIHKEYSVARGGAQDGTRVLDRAGAEADGTGVREAMKGPVEPKYSTISIQKSCQFLKPICGI